MRVDTADARPELAAACMPGSQVLKRTGEAEEGTVLDIPRSGGDSLWPRLYQRLLVTIPEPLCVPRGSG